jgi:hypothetical protein
LPGCLLRGWRGAILEVLDDPNVFPVTVERINVLRFGRLDGALEGGGGGPAVAGGVGPGRIGNGIDAVDELLQGGIGIGTGPVAGDGLLQRSAERGDENVFRPVGWQFALRNYTQATERVGSGRLCGKVLQRVNPLVIDGGEEEVEFGVVDFLN